MGAMSRSCLLFGGSVDKIGLRVTGAKGLGVSDEGSLTVQTGNGEISYTKPVAWQEGEGGRIPVEVDYWVKKDSYGFVLGDYDRALSVLIDPLLQSTYLGGTIDDAARAMAIHPGCPMAHTGTRATHRVAPTK
jgi:hypothetical protein